MTWNTFDLVDKKNINSSFITDCDEEDTNSNVQALLQMTKRLCVDKKQRISIVLDIDNTLIFASKEKIKNYDFVIMPDAEESAVYYVQMRPYLIEFLEFCQKNCEIYIFSAATKKYVKKILEHILIEGIEVKKVFTREHCVEFPTGSKNYVKDLRILGKPSLNKVLLIDDLPESFMQKENGILIKPFEGDENDNELEKMVEVINSRIDHVCCSSFTLRL